MTHSAPASTARSSTHLDAEQRRLAAKRRMFRRRRITVAIGLIVVLLGGYSLAVGLAPLPELQPRFTAEAESIVEADATEVRAAVDAQSLPTALGWQDDEQVWANDEGQYRIASLTKLITALVGLEAKPVEEGTDGAEYTLTEADAALVDEVLAQDGTFAPVPVGTTLTTRQMLELILLPSANNYAISYAHWVFGDNEGFLAAAGAWLDKHDLSSVRVVEPTGLSDENVANATDVLRIARLALENPLIASIVAQPSAEIPGIGTVHTTNPLLGEPGVIGLKTGTTFPAGYSLAAAEREAITGRERVAIAVTLERDSDESRADDTRSALKALATGGQEVPLVAEGAAVGRVTTWTGDTVRLVTSEGSETVLLPGESASTTTALDEVAASPKGTAAGTVSVTSPDGTSNIRVVTDRAILEPDFWWRFTHPGELF